MADTITIQPNPANYNFTADIGISQSAPPKGPAVPSSAPGQIKEKYVCIAAQSSSQAKYWNNPFGWREVVNFLKDNGYRVLCIDKEAVHGADLVWNHIPDGTEDFKGTDRQFECSRLISAEQVIKTIQKIPSFRPAAPKKKKTQRKMRKSSAYSCMQFLWYWGLLLILGIIFPGCSVPERGAKVFQSEAPLSQAEEADVSLLFVSPALASQNNFLQEAHAKGLQIFVTFGVFYNPGYATNHPDALAITNTGEIARDHWLEMICPSNRDYKEAFKKQLKEFVTTCHPDGITLDFCRHFVYWENLRTTSDFATLPRSCYCQKCLRAFERSCGFTLPPQNPVKWIQENADREYNRFRANQITEFAAELRSMLQLTAPGMPVIFHTVPFAEGSPRDLSDVTGQKLSDLDSLGFTAFSPMLYRALLHETEEWERQQLAAAAATAPHTPLWPCIQAGSVYGESQTADEFAKDLELCCRHPATSKVLVFTLERLSGLPEHLNAFQH